MPKVSIIVCAYNAEKTVADTVSSLLGQTYKDTEIIVVNDGSTDSTASLLKKMSDENPNITVLSTENAGPSEARNKGISASQGEYIAFCDADDTLDPGAVEEMVKLAENDGSDLVICGYYHDTVGKKGITSKKMCAEEKCYPSAKMLSDDFLKLKSNYVLDACWNKLFKASVIKENGIVFPKGELYEDTAFVVGYLKFSGAVSVTDKCFYHYVQRTSSVTKKYDPRRYSDLLKHYFRLSEFFGTDDKNRKFINMFFIRSVYAVSSALCEKGAGEKGALNKQIGDAAHSELFLKCVSDCTAQSFSDKVTLFVAKRNIGFLNRFYCRIIYFLKHRMKRFFDRFK